MDEDQLVALSRAGDGEAFNRLVERYQQLVYNLAYRMLGERFAAEDATQEAFLAAFRGIRSLRGEFRPWLLRIATNACYDQLRRRRSVGMVELSFLDETDAEPSDPVETPEEWVLRRELAVVLQRGLLALPPDQRAAVVLSDVQGLSYEEIASVTRTSLGTVKSRLSRGRARLRDFLRPHRELLPQLPRLLPEEEERAKGEP